MTDVLVSVDSVCFEARDQYDTAEVFLDAQQKEGRNFLKGYDAVVETLANLRLIQRRLNGNAIHDGERVETLILEGQKLKAAYRSKYQLSLLPAPADGKRYTSAEVKPVERPMKPVAGPAAVVRRQTHKMPRGEAHSQARLTKDNVLAIRAWFANLKHKPTKDDYMKMGARYGVTHSNIVSIVRRRTWTHI